MKYFILLFLLFAACDKNVPIWKRWMFDHPPAKPNGEMDYSPEYIKGWQDGCETAGGATANHLYKNFFEFTKDEELTISSAEYSLAWNDAYRYCTSYLLQHNFNWYGKRVI
jgi:hypothetical protein